MRKMCPNSSKLSPCSPFILFSDFSNSKLSRGRNLPRRRLSRRRIRWSTVEAKERKVEVAKRKMELKNFKLYMKNKSIIEENEKLRNKACLLRQENQALFFQLQALNENNVL